MSGGRPATPTWRRAFDKIERLLGEPLEGAVASQQFVDVMAVGMKARRTATGAVSGVVRGVAGVVLRTVNIPTRDDVQRMNRNLVVLTTEVRRLKAEQQASKGRQGVPPADEAGDAGRE
jgi:hypothetical protein